MSHMRTREVLDSRDLIRFISTSALRAFSKVRSVWWEGLVKCLVAMDGCSDQHPPCESPASNLYARESLGTGWDRHSECSILSPFCVKGKWKGKRIAFLVFLESWIRGCPIWLLGFESALARICPHLLSHVCWDRKGFRIYGLKTVTETPSETDTAM